jgi:hypothetical protein
MPSKNQDLRTRMGKGISDRFPDTSRTSGYKCFFSAKIWLYHSYKI